MSDPEPREEWEHKRGVIKEFSRGSRRRMMTSLALIDREQAGLPSMLSLTYPDECEPWPISERKVKRDLGVFRLRFERRYGKKPVLWRRELQTRKSGVHLGDLAPHVHLLTWGIVPDAEDRAWVSRTWFEVVGSGSEKHRRAGTQWFQPDCWRGTLAYVSKYHAKISEHSAEGRSWGYWFREGLPIHLISDEIPQDAFHPVRRVLRRYVERRSGRKVPRTAKDARWSGFSAFLSERTGEALARWAWDVGWSTERG